jgi:hypothetical protein
MDEHARDAVSVIPVGAEPSSEKPGSGSHSLWIVERVGRRLIVGCGCGNYFLCATRRAVCDNCGAEGRLDGLRAKDYAGAAGRAASEIEN